MNAPLEVDIRNASFRTNPYPTFSRLRAEAPVLCVNVARRKTAWLVTRYDDVMGVLKGKDFVKDKQNVEHPGKKAGPTWTPGIVKPLMRNMLDVDPPDHTRLRRLVHKAFTSRVVEQLSDRIYALTDDLLDASLAQGKMDIIRDYALPLPTTIIAEMLGVPVADRHKFHRWSSAMVSANPNAWEMARAIPSVIAFIRYLRKLVRKRRTSPQDDLVSALVQVEDEGDQLDEDELVAMIFLLLVAGHETTVNLIGNGVLALMQHPDQMTLLRSDPDLIETAVEELLRFDGPLKTATERYARVDVEIAGIRIPQGDLVYAVLGSANRDEHQFDDPDRLDLTRTPNRHLAFGQGIHYCLGAPLARLEGRIALTMLLRRAKNLHLAVPTDALRWKKGLVLRGLKSLPVAFQTRP